MRNIPGLSLDVLSRAADLAAKERDDRAAFRVGATVAPDAKAFITAAPRDSITPAVVRDGVATLRLYDYIDSEGGYWGISADEFAQALDEIEGADRIEVHINSGGGSVWDGLAIMNTLRSVGLPVKAVVDGVAASAASFIAVACDQVEMMPNSRLMIHDALGLCMGQSADMREYAEFLDESSDNIADIYATKAGGTTRQWRDRMRAKGLLGEWFTPQQALDAGLIDAIGGMPGDASDADLVDQQPKAETQEPAEQPAVAKTEHDPFVALQQRRHRMNARRASA
jgi:ATP-dependent protease ClpP protease subunit